MKTYKFKKIMAVSIITLIGFAMAGTASIATTKNNDSKDNKILEQVSNESNTAMRDLRSARVALFDGQTDAAKTYLDGVKKNLEAAKKEAPQMVVTVNTEKKIGDKTVSSKQVTENSDYVPIDTWLVLSEDFVATQDKNAKVAEANEHLKKGDKAKAVDVLRSADIGVSVGRMLMPLKATEKNVDKAITLMNDHKYYEANLALKGAEDGLIVDSVAIVTPATPDNKTPAANAETQKG